MSKLADLTPKFSKEWKKGVLQVCCNFKIKFLFSTSNFVIIFSSGFIHIFCDKTYAPMKPRNTLLLLKEWKIIIFTKLLVHC